MRRSWSPLAPDGCSRQFSTTHPSGSRSTTEITATRLDSVERYAVNFPGELVAVIDTAVPPAERAGDQIDQIQSRVISSTPNPVLPAFQAAGSGQ